MRSRFFSFFLLFLTIGTSLMATATFLHQPKENGKRSYIFPASGVEIVKE